MKQTRAEITRNADAPTPEDDGIHGGDAKQRAMPLPGA
jgi:hypothetical protein